jgi:CheY-like chemotaxis protein
MSLVIYPLRLWKGAGSALQMEWKGRPEKPSRALEAPLEIDQFENASTRFLEKHRGHTMPQALILSIGSDARVLDTRELILRSAGYSVVSTTSIKEAVYLFKDGEFDVVVLCHTLPTKDCERLTGAVRASGSRILIVCVSAATFDEHNAFADATLDKNPAAFLRAIEELLRSHAQPRALHWGA